jgi:hypothetical protein
MTGLCFLAPSAPPPLRSGKQAGVDAGPQQGRPLPHAARKLAGVFGSRDCSSSPDIGIVSGISLQVLCIRYLLTQKDRLLYTDFAHFNEKKRGNGGAGRLA